ncbi:Hypothetical protein SCF082_LOCUS50058 [Durusdinium trenchii]|uniref:Uncharacterized protein n=1 Tax=Durusdinium trenchii TaxID=1381693 RepID=A0ABP0S580_9DINO
MARRERRAKRMADWYGLAVEGERGAAAKKQCVARAEEVAEKLPPGAAKGLQNAAPSGPEGIDPITMERLLSQVQKGGPSVQNEALVAVTGLPPQHAAKLLEFALEKSKELRDPSMYMVSTVARGFKPRWHEMVEASVPSKGKGVQLELAQDRKPRKARSVLLGEFSHRPEISGRPATSGFSFPCAWHLVYEPESSDMDSAIAVCPLGMDPPKARKQIFLAYISPIHYNAIIARKPQ